jgi:hypothetical protein
MEEQIAIMLNRNLNAIPVGVGNKIAGKDPCAKEITSHVMAFAKWGVENTVRLYWRDELYQILGTNISVKSVEELYQYWKDNVKQ